MSEQQHPTRQQIRSAIDDAVQQLGHVLLPLTDHEVTGIVETAGDAVLALLSQPTPSAEPKMVDCPKCGWQYDHGNGTHAPWPPVAAPPSIAGMAVGTTFWARFKRRSAFHLFMRIATRGRLVTADNESAWDYDDIDLSSIRDEQEPESPNAH